MAWKNRPTVCVGATVIAMVLLVSFPSLVGNTQAMFTGRAAAAIPTAQDTVSSTRTLTTPPGLPPPPGTFAGTSADPLYDEQLGTTFTQDFTSIAANVTTVEQTDPDSGTGPAYLLNGLSNAGYWYQIGVSWNWFPGNLPGFGFDMIYSVWGLDDVLVYPRGGQILVSFSGSVNPGDNVTLKLYFGEGSQVVMTATDSRTGASANASYSALGANEFVGLPSTPANSYGYFTGLMTEWYHSNAYYGNEQHVVYSHQGTPLSSAWMWAGETGFSACSTKNCTRTSTLFVGYTPTPVSYSSLPDLQSFSSNGSVVFSDAYEFVSGSLSDVSLTLSFSVAGAGSYYAPPTLTFRFDGFLETAAVGASPSIYVVNQGSEWNVTNPLSGSYSNERWMTDQQTSGVANTSLVIGFDYYNQYFVTLGNRTAAHSQGTALATPPLTTYYLFGIQHSLIGAANVWADAGSVAVSCANASPVVGSTVLCGAMAVGQSPTGRIAWSSSGPGSYSSDTCRLTKGYCSVKYTPASASSAQTLNASYSGNKRVSPSAGTLKLTPLRRFSKITIACKPVSVAAGSQKAITCTAKVNGYSPGGVVTWFQTQPANLGSVNMTSESCNLSGGACSIKMTGGAAGAVVVTATYNGDANNLGSTSLPTILDIKQA